MPYLTKAEVASMFSYTGIGPFIDPKPGSIWASRDVAAFCGDNDRKLARYVDSRPIARRPRRRKGG